MDVSTSTTLHLIVYLHSSLHRSDKNVSARVIVMETDVHLRPERVETTVTAGFTVVTVQATNCTRFVEREQTF